MTGWPIDVHPGATVWHPLPEGVRAALLDWLRTNGIDPGWVPNERRIVIHANTVEFWWLHGPETADPTGSQVVEASWGAGDLPLSRRLLALAVPLPEDLAVALRKVAMESRMDEARIRANLAAAEVYDEVMGS